MRHHRQRRRSSPPPPADLLRSAVSSWGADPSGFDAIIGTLIRQLEPALSAVDTMLASALDRLWDHGWTPIDLVHVVGRELTAQHADVAAEQVVDDGRRRTSHGQPLHDGWEEQLSRLQDRSRELGIVPPEERLRRLVEVLCVTARLPAVPRTVPPPGSSRDGVPHGVRLDERMLERVRALLAKAESTLYEEEAEAFIAKAQELIARHAIDEALLHTVDDVGEPSVRRIVVDDPYADAKAYLVAEVGRANRCRVVHSAGFGWVTAFGYDHDLAAVQLLATSLLAQATSAMVRQGPRRDAYGRSRTRSFRRAFLLGFAQRIGERLQEATEGQVAATVDADGSLLPVLAAREDRLIDAEQKAFPDIRRRSASISSPAGWWEGRSAAEVADLDVSPPRLHS